MESSKNGFNIGFDWVCPFPVTVTTRIITFLVGNPFLQTFICHCYWEGATPKVLIICFDDFFSSSLLLLADVFSLFCQFFGRGYIGPRDCFFLKLLPGTLTRIPTQSLPVRPKKCYLPNRKGLSSNHHFCRG